ncbi:MAG: gluconate 2-dehydrogenase subunit 3 family protein [Actinobacteria bacterium]|nr:gluconate 2-dehydrogenase subunit 3 family protein [Actinomycetota bacterium]
MSDGFRDASHLPKQAGRNQADPDGLPRQRRGTTPQMHGRYPDLDILAFTSHWDGPTRTLILDRVENPPPFRFFDAAEVETLKAFCDTVMHQTREPRIPVLAYVDEKLHTGRLDGYQYADMPDDRETWRLLARALDEEARARGGDAFGRVPEELRLEICGHLADDEVEGGTWEQIPRAFQVAMRAILAAFYSHPWAWNEIGFPGPAYPRGYMRLGIDQHEEWTEDEAFAVDPVGDVKERGLE